MPRFIALLAVLFGLVSAPASLRAAASFETISDGATPPVAYAIDHSDSTLTVRVRVEAFRAGQPTPRLQLGLSAASTAVFDQTHAKIDALNDAWIYTFTLPNVSFTKPEAARFRWALLVEWLDGAGRSLQRQNYFTPTSWPPYRDIGREASAWTVFSLADYRIEQERRAQRITFDFQQPIDGKASVVIENAGGRRVRNLVTGQPLKAGAHQFSWDGLDEDGRLVPPGDYRWRAISHPGIRAEMQMYFYAPGERPWANHTWLADHSNPTAAAAYGDRVALGAPVAESGNNIVLTDLDGKTLASANLSSFIGLGRLFLALGPDRIYALNEGSPGYNSVRTDADGKEYVYGDLTLVSWDYAGTQKRYSGKNGEHVVIEYKKPLSEGSGWRKDRLRLTLTNLRGAVFLDGLLYLSLHDENRILMIDPKDGRATGEIAVTEPGPIATNGRALYGLSENQVFRVATPKPGAAVETLFSCTLSPTPKAAAPEGTPLTATGMAVSSTGEIFLSDNGVDQNIKVYNERGKLLRELGARGGRAPSGAWKADEIRHPYGIAIDSRDRLWLAENEEAPKRISVWDTASARVTKEIFGPTPYGGSGAGFDPRDATRWFAAGSMWALDFKTKEASIQSVLHHRTKAGQLADIVDGHNLRTIHHGDRTFVFAKGRTLQVFELMPDGAARLRAVLGSLSGFQADSPRFSVPAVFTEHPLLKDELAAFTQVTGKFGDYRINEAASKNARDYTILWIDRNGDEVAQVDELQVAGKGPRVSLPYWSALSPDLDLGFAVENDKSWARGTLRLRGFLPSGAPDWDLAEALATAVPAPDIAVGGGLQASMMDTQGRLLLNASPMLALDRDGTVRWRLRNDWAGVHGSHRAPLPETGVMQGTLGYLGDAAFDDEGDITVLNGNHGRFFALTTDGIYLDEFFDDVRVALERNPNRVGGEAFGGYFAKDAKTGRYLLQAGHGAYRIYELKGMDRLLRSSGSLPVSAAQLSAAEKLNEARVARDTVRKEATLRAASVTVEAAPADWPIVWTAEWGDVSRAFPHARVKAVRDGSSLVLGYEVKDPTPWLNNGTAQNLLFKTGDAVDFQFSTDPSASVTRGDPAPGDRRLLIANYQGKPIAVLYDYRVPGTESPVLFNSPWRSAQVDRVTVLSGAVVKVSKTKSGYTVTARIPLASLGLPSTGGAPLMADFGVIYGDEQGEANILRSYWANPATGLVNDVPGETMINPSLWGVFKTE